MIFHDKNHLTKVLILCLFIFYFGSRVSISYLTTKQTNLKRLTTNLADPKMAIGITILEHYLTVAHADDIATGVRYP